MKKRGLSKAAFLLFAGIGLAGALSIPSRAAAREVFSKPGADGTVEVQVTKPARTLVVILSGDGGWWGDLDAQLANRVAKAGYAVVGLDTNIWFTDQRTPQDVADHLSDLVQRYMTQTGATKYVLIGYSFGADMVAPAYARMKANLAGEASALILLSPGRQASFQVNLLEETGVQQGDYNLSPDFKHLPKAQTACIFGAQEKRDTGCADPSLSGAALISLPGGHHYNHDTAALAGRVLSLLKIKAPA